MAKGKEKEMNYYAVQNVILCNENSGKDIVRIAASTVYRCLLTANSLQQDPAVPPWVYRVDEIDITEDLDLGDNAVAILVAGYNINAITL